jgi:ArsR family transcriptional regulator
MTQKDTEKTECEGHEHPAHEHSPLPEWQIEESAAMFQALGDVARLRILETLMDGQHCVSELAEESGDGMSTVSQRLKTLRHGGLVKRRREGRHIYYALADDHVVELLRNALAHAAEGNLK